MTRGRATARHSQLLSWLLNKENYLELPQTKQGEGRNKLQLIRKINKSCSYRIIGLTCAVMPRLLAEIIAQNWNILIIQVQGKKKSWTKEKVKVKNREEREVAKGREGRGREWEQEWEFVWKVSEKGREKKNAPKPSVLQLCNTTINNWNYRLPALQWFQSLSLPPHAPMKTLCTITVRRDYREIEIARTFGPVSPLTH